MLNGKTPREANTSKKKREKLIQLVDGIEDIERQVSPDERFDVNVLREALGLEKKRY